MTSKERVEAAARYRAVDRIPAGLFGTHPDYLEGLRQYAGCPSVEAFFEAYAVDIWHCHTGLAYRGGEKLWRGRSVLPTRELYDERNHAPPFAGVESLDEIAAYPFPVPGDFDGEALAREAESHRQFALCPGINAAVFHNYLYMTGQLEGFCLLKTAPELAHAIIERITDYWIGYFDVVMAAVGPWTSLIDVCNDFGTQRTLFISPEDFRDFFKTPLTRLYSRIHDYGVDVLHHSCGAVRPLLVDFIAMGADILNPIQVSAENMALDGLVGEYYGKIAFYGGIDTQYLLPHGPEERIRETVRAAAALFGNGGGFILSGSQGMMEDIPFPHAAAMLDPALRRL